MGSRTPNQQSVISLTHFVVQSFICLLTRCETKNDSCYFCISCCCQTVQEMRVTRSSWRCRCVVDCCRCLCWRRRRQCQSSPLSSTCLSVKMSLLSEYCHCSLNIITSSSHLIRLSTSLHLVVLLAIWSGRASESCLYQACEMNMIGSIIIFVLTTLLIVSCNNDQSDGIYLTSKPSI